MSSHEFILPLKERLIRYYQHYNPAQIAKVDAILDLYEHDSVALFADLAMRYGPEPPPHPSDATWQGPSDVAHSGAAGETSNPTMEDENGHAGAVRRRTGSGLPPAPPPPSQQSGQLLPSDGPWTTLTADVAPTAHSDDARPPPLTMTNLSMLPQDVLASSTMSATIAADMADASSPYHRNSAHRFSATAASGGGVLDGAFSPTRRRLPNRLGGLFADLPPPTTHPDASSSVLRNRDPSSTSSDALVANATSVIYRRDTKATTETAARMIMEEAKRHATIGHLAASTVRSMQRAVAAECYQARLDALEHPDGQQPSHSPSYAHAAVVPPVRAMQSTLNVDEMSSYQALAARQRSNAQFAAGASLVDGNHPMEHHAVASSGPRVGGLFIAASHPKPFSGRPLEPYDGNTSGALGNAEMLRRRLRTLQMSPLVSKVRATAGGLPQRSSVDSSSLQHSRPPVVTGEADNDDDGAVDMICTECGLICKIVPGHEHEVGHVH